VRAKTGEASDVSPQVGADRVSVLIVVDFVIAGTVYWVSTVEGVEGDGGRPRVGGAYPPRSAALSTCRA
jgi:hypothetical protein